MARMTETATKTIRECADPVLEALEERARDVRRAVVTGRRAVEDCADETTLQVRRHPFMAVGLAAGIGSVLGCLVGFTLGRRGRTAGSTA